MMHLKIILLKLKDVRMCEQIDVRECGQSGIDPQDSLMEGWCSK